MDIREQVRDFLVEQFLLGDATGLDTAASLLATGVLDSTGVMELVLFLEETYVFQVADEEMLPENLDSVDNIVRFVARKLAQRSANSGAVTPTHAAPA